MFAPALLGHLDAQLVSARRLLEAVLRQAEAIRARDVEGVLARLAELQAEMERRGALERDRTTILVQAAQALGRSAHELTLEDLCALIDDASAAQARERSAELRGLLAEVGREHLVNRALMRQELAFLEHLTRLLGAPDDAGPAYGPGAQPSAPAAAFASAGQAPQPVLAPRAAAARVLDLQA